MTRDQQSNVVGELILPAMLFAALGAMTWAVRGCSGFGAVAGCIFAGVTWGAAWWYLSHDPTGQQKRRYSSGWVIPALTFGVGLAGARGWMQWPSFFDGKLFTNASRGQFVPIDRTYGFLWLFIAGVPWAGWGACALAWCGSKRDTRLWHWIIRVGLGLSIRNGLKGWFNIYKGNEQYWSRVLWQYAGPAIAILMILIALSLLVRTSRSPIGVRHSALLFWLVLIVQNVIAQLVTGPHSSWPETAFAIYYLLLFAISGLIVYRENRLGQTKVDLLR